MSETTPFLVSLQGVRVPAIIYGTAWKAERTAELVQQAIASGFRGIDTAAQPKHYDEAGVGEGLSRALAGGLTRADVYLQTKFTPLHGQDPARLPYDPTASLPEQVAQSLESSLSHLRTRYLDGLILHSPLPDDDELMAVWQAMERTVASGDVRQLGLSNCYHPDQLSRLYQRARIKPALVQNRFHAANGYDREIRAVCREHGILYQSFWTLTANPQLLAHDTLRTLAAHYRRTPAQIFFRYLSQNGIIPLTGTTSASHMREDLEIFEFTLRDSERELITRSLDMPVP